MLPHSGGCEFNSHNDNEHSSAHLWFKCASLFPFTNGMFMMADMPYDFVGN